MAQDEQVRRIQWNTRGDEISLYTSFGYVGKLKGQQAKAFGAVVSLGFAEAMKVARGESGALEAETQQATPEPED